MKTLLRTYLSSLVSLWVTAQLISGLKITEGYQGLIISAGALSIIHLFIRPILKLFFLPINLFSLGLLSWLINVAILYLLTIFVPQITITTWQFPGFSYQGIILPSYSFNQITSFILIALTISFIMNFLTWLSSK